MKKALACIVFILIISSLLISPRARSKTLNDIYEELSALERELYEKIDTSILSKEQIKRIKDTLIEIGKLVEEKEAEVHTVENNKIIFQNEKENIELKKEVIESYKFITNIVLGQFNSLSGQKNIINEIYENTTLEYTEKELNDEYNELIKNISINEQKEVEIESTKKFLVEQNEMLLKEQKKLGSLISELDEDEMDLKKDIDVAKNAILDYEKMGCQKTDILAVCSQIGKDIGFSRPVMKGHITSEYGIRLHPTKNVILWHHAVDIGGNAAGTSVYSIANGKVVVVNLIKTPEIANSSCGGNYVIVQHNINGIYYASRYMHLSSISVNVGQTVTKETIIGTIGGTEKYDRCSTGAHLDLAIAKGIYAEDFYSFRVPYTVNPRELINFPTGNTPFTGR